MPSLLLWSHTPIEETIYALAPPVSSLPYSQRGLMVFFLHLKTLQQPLTLLRLGKTLHKVLHGLGGPGASSHPTPRQPPWLGHGSLLDPQNICCRCKFMVVCIMIFLFLLAANLKARGLSKWETASIYLRPIRIAIQEAWIQAEAQIVFFFFYF